MTRPDTLGQLVRALASAAREHGTPNAFTPGELEAEYGGPAPMHTGALLRFRFVEVASLLRREGFVLGDVQKVAKDGQRYTRIGLNSIHAFPQGGAR